MNKENFCIFAIDGGISFADAEVGDGAVKFKACSSDYQWGAWYLNNENIKIPLISKDAETWTIAAGYIVNGEQVNPNAYINGRTDEEEEMDFKQKVADYLNNK